MSVGKAASGGYDPAEEGGTGREANQRGGGMRSVTFEFAIAAAGFAGLVSAFVFARLSRVFGAVLVVLVAAGLALIFINDKSRTSGNLMKRMGAEVVASVLILSAGSGFAIGLLAFRRTKP